MTWDDTHDLGACFWEQVRIRRDEPAVTDGRRVVDYASLGVMVQAAQQRLRLRAVPDGAPIGLVLDKTPESIALILACLGSMQRFLLLSPQLGSAARHQLLTDTGCTVMFGPDGWEALAGPGLGSNPRGDTAPGSVMDGATLVPDVGDVSFMLTTSGSTGLPKVVPISDAAVSRFVAWASDYFAIGPGVPVLSYAPLNFDLCFLDVWTTLAVGGTVVLVSEIDSTRAGRLAALIDETRVEVVQAVPLAFSILASGSSRLPGVREVIFTGDAIGAATLARLPELFPNARLSNLYGCTETNDSFIHHPDPSDLSIPVPIGQPLGGVEARVMADGREVDGAGQGELFISTPFQARGYLDLQRSLDRFVPDPASRSRSVFFRTGDLVRREPSGAVVLAGRIDRQVKVRGVAVNTEQIETVISSADGVNDVAVVAVPDPLLGHRLIAFLTTADPGTDGLAVRRHCAAHLPRAAIPGEIRMQIDDLPRTTTGKIDRNQLAAGLVEAAAANSSQNKSDGS